MFAPNPIMIARFIKKTINRNVKFLYRSKFDLTGSYFNDGIKVGSIISFKHVFPQKDVDIFSSICGDDNPIHINQEFASATTFKGTIVHGIFVASLFSTAFGRGIHGAIYVSQSLDFRKPVHVGVDVEAIVEILKIEDRRKGQLLTCSTIVKLLDSGDVAVEGTGKILVPLK